MTIYINRKSITGRYIETMDEFESHKEANATLHEYQLCDYSAHYYISSRCCKAWRGS